jgi:YidC/Oxa1 family membrane protein insertase
MGKVFNLLLFQPILNILILLYKILFSNFALAIVALTFLIRGALFSFTASPTTKMAKKIAELKPEIDRLKAKYKGDARKLQVAQLSLYQKHGINPAAGCLPQLIQILVLIALFQVFRMILLPEVEVIEKLNPQLYFSWLRFSPGETINTRFLYLDLTKPDLIHLPISIIFGSLKIEAVPGLFLILAAVTQFLSSKMMAPTVKWGEKMAKKTREKSDDISTAMQEQMLYMMPVMTLLIGLKFPSGLVLYWLTFSLFTIIQQSKSKFLET